jgi:hypothetical protein
MQPPKDSGQDDNGKDDVDQALERTVPRFFQRMIEIV